MTDQNMRSSEIIHSHLPELRYSEIERPVSIYRERTRAAIVNSSGNESQVAEVLRRLSPQVDEIFVYLENLDSVPEQLIFMPENIRFFTGKELGRNARFTFVDGFTGYYIPVSHDVEYSRSHVSSIIAGIERYDRNAVVGWRGATLPVSRGARLTFLNALHQDHHVDILDTATLGFHTDTVRIDSSILYSHNDPEVSFAVEAKKQHATMITIAAYQLEALSSASPRASTKVSVPRHNSILEAHPHQKLSAPLSNNPRVRKVSIIGRSNVKRWKKGGILKSVLLTKEMLAAHGCAVELVDIEDGAVFELNQPDVLMVYVGDPERPDFKRVHQIVEYHAGKGIPVLVNLSEDGHEVRTSEIQRIMQDWYRKFNGRVSMMSFSHGVSTKHEYRNFDDAIVTIPKTLTFVHDRLAEYASSSGIFVGDVAKLSDPRIVGDNVYDNIRLLRSAIPEAKIYGLRQYKPKYQVPDGIDIVWPFLSPTELAKRLSQVRLMISFSKFATYEMVPVEAAALGVPVLYPDMPQSLNEAIGLAGIRYRNSFDLVNSAETLYRNPVLWRQFSRAGMRKGHSQDFDVTSAQMYLAIKNYVERHHKEEIWS